MILSITNIKGGVGKTTTAVNLAERLSERGRRTLLIDPDPQAQATRCFIDWPPDRSVGDFIMDRPSQASKSVLNTGTPNLDMVPATPELTGTAELLSTRVRREERLRRALETMQEEYREIILDCPPALGILSHNAITASDLLLVPAQPGVGAVKGLEALLQAARELRDEEDVPYRILITMFDVRTTRTNDLFQDLLEEHRKRLLKTIIFKSESLNQANLAGKPVARFMPSSRGAYDYESLCDEILKIRVKSRS